MSASESQIERIIKALQGIEDSNGLTAPNWLFDINENLKSIAEALNRLADHG